jgi:hypothetical protein
MAEHNVFISRQVCCACPALYVVRLSPDRSLISSHLLRVHQYVRSQQLQLLQRPCCPCSVSGWVLAGQKSITDVNCCKEVQPHSLDVSRSIKWVPVGGEVSPAPALHSFFLKALVGECSALILLGRLPLMLTASSPHDFFGTFFCIHAHVQASDLDLSYNIPIDIFKNAL